MWGYRTRFNRGFGKLHCVTSEGASQPQLNVMSIE